MLGGVVVVEEEGSEKNNGGGVSLKMRLPKAEVENLIKSSKDEVEPVKRIMSLCMANSNNDNKSEIEKNEEGIMVMNQEMHWKCSRGSRVGERKKARKVWLISLQ
ncbi:plastid movement impaired protein [Sesbania bispinosa]|nr:plastid movement impaired protein [Sesbania bispinosa]